MTAESLRLRLLALNDPEYKKFNTKLIPTVDAHTVIGIRTPILRKIAKELAQDGGVSFFLQDLPHRFFEENQLHAFLIETIRDFDRCLNETERFLPYVDNWATCDQMTPKALKKDLDRLSNTIDIWMESAHPYTVRFAVGLRIRFYLGEAFRPEQAQAVAQLNREEYYVRMMQAWYFATALAKRPDDIFPYLTEHRLSPTVHKMTVRKALESFRISEEQKQILRHLSI